MTKYLRFQFDIIAVTWLKVTLCHQRKQ